MGNLFSLNFWFKMNPGYLAPLYQKGLIIFFIFLVCLFVASLIVKSRKKGLYTIVWRRISTFSLTNIGIGLVLMFFNYELIPFLSARFWFLFWAVGITVWIIYMIKKLKEIPVRKQKLDDEKEYKRYIP